MLSMWNPRRFFRNLCAYSFAAVLLIGFLHTIVGGLVAGLMLFFAPLAVAAMQEGLKYGSHRSHAPDAGKIWWVAREMAEVYLAFLVIVALLTALSVQDFRMTLAEGNILLIFCCFGVLTGIALVVARWSYEFGVKLETEHQNNNAG